MSQQNIEIFEIMILNIQDFVFVFDFSHSNGCVVVAHGGFIFYFPNDVLHLFKCLFAIHITSLGMCLLIFPHLKN